MIFYTIVIVKYMKNNLDVTKPRYSKQILPVSWSLSPNSDQHQFSPNNIHILPRGMVIRVNKMITKQKML